MKTVFSHIIQKRFSQSYEDVATDALAFILDNYEAAHSGMMKLLSGIVADIPSLKFKTQQSEGSIRPDMWGIHETEPRVFVENKFWAGLTENQPVNYLKQLADYTQPSILLVVAPEAREHTLWHELLRRLKNAGITVTDRDIPAGMVNSITTKEDGPILALTFWSRLLSALELEVADDQKAKNDLSQLRALCISADIGKFTPVTAHEVTDQRTPDFIIQLYSIVEESIKAGAAQGILDRSGLTVGITSDRIGRYARFGSEQRPGIWFGIQFQLWRKHGGTPLWLVFYPGEFGRSHEVQPILEPWAAKEGIFTVWEDDEFAMAVDIETGEEEDQVVRAIVDLFKEVENVLSTLE